MSEKGIPSKGIPSASDVIEAVETIDYNRFNNVGIPVKLSFGDYTVRELGAFDLIEIVTNALELLMQFSDDNEAEDGVEIPNDFELIAKIGRSKQLKAKVCDLFSMYCSEPDKSKFERLSISDLSQLVKAVKQVTDFEQVKELFLASGFQKYLTKTPTSTED